MLLAIDDFGECVWEQVAADRNKRTKELHQGPQTGETKLQQEAIDKRTRRKIRQTTRPINPPTFKYTHCGRLPLPSRALQPFQGLFQYKLTPSSKITLAWRTSMVFRDRGIATNHGYI